MEIRKGLEGGSGSSEAEETTKWLNGIINWLFLNLTDSPNFRGGFNRAISEIVVDLRRSPLGYFLIDSAVESCNLGGSAPNLKSVQILTGKVQSSNVPLSLKFDLEYEGVCALSMKFKTILGIDLIVETFIKKFEGKVCLVIQDRTIHFCLLDPPTQLKTSTSVSFSSTNSVKYQVPFINYLVSSEKIIKKGITTGGPCFPKFVGQWYRAGPDQPPYPWDPSVLENPHRLYNWSPKLE